ncbi:hypothetical protein ABZP36_010662 [Zizania latifolia]
MAARVVQGATSVSSMAACAARTARLASLARASWSELEVSIERAVIDVQMVMGNMREAEERLEYWRLKYGLADEDLDKYMSYLDDDNKWFDV